jgi:hypothetical protein
VRLERWRGASNTESFACATSYFNHISGVPASLRIRIKGCFDLIGAWKSNHGVDALSRLLAAQYTPATTVAAPPPPMIPPGVRERLVWPIKPQIDITIPVARGFYMSSVDGFSKWTKKILMDFLTPKLHDSALFFRRNEPFVSDGTDMIKHRHMSSLLDAGSRS